MNNALFYVLDVILGLAALLFMLRFLLQAVRADFYNPITQSIVSITDPVLKPLRLVIPSRKNLDFAAFLGAYGAKCLLAYLVLKFGGNFSGSIATVLITGLYQTLLLVTEVFWWSILIGVIASFVAQGNQHPALQVVAQLTDPLMEPVRKVLPSAGGLDFSPLVVILGLGVIQQLLPSLFQAIF